MTMPQSASLNGFFKELDEKKIEIVSKRNKSNRLRGLFLLLTRKDKSVDNYSDAELHKYRRIRDGRGNPRGARKRDSFRNLAFLHEHRSTARFYGDTFRVLRRRAFLARGIAQR